MPDQNSAPEQYPGVRAEQPVWSAPAENPFTFQGEVAGLAAFASGVSRSRGWKRRAGTVLALLPIVVLAVSLLIMLVENGSP